MSRKSDKKPETNSPAGRHALENIIAPRPRDLGGFTVLRVLPAAERRSVGPFVFLDQMGPAELEPGAGIDVRPHPHIGLATVTYLFAGSIVHRDSLGNHRTIQPGAASFTPSDSIANSESNGKNFTVSKSGLLCPSKRKKPILTLPIMRRQSCRSSKAKESPFA